MGSLNSYFKAEQCVLYLEWIQAIDQSHCLAGVSARRDSILGLVGREECILEMVNMHEALVVSSRSTSWCAWLWGVVTKLEVALPSCFDSDIDRMRGVNVRSLC